jgi:hypothetical protein
MKVMSRFGLWLALGLVPLAAAIGEGAGGAKAAGSGLACEIRIKEGASGMTLEGVVRSKTAVSGTYRFEIEAAGGGGSSDISQSGRFSADAGAPAVLGKVMLGGEGGSFVARLAVSANGERHECTERFGGGI